MNEGREPSKDLAFSRPYLSLSPIKADQVMRREVTPAQLAVYVALFSHLRTRDLAWPSASRLARMTKVSERQVRRALKALVGLCWIELANSTPGGVNKFRLLGLKESRGTPDAHVTPDAEVLTLPSLTPDANVTQKGTGRKGTVLLGQEGPEGFSEFWALWPKKTDKANAAKVWRKSVKASSVEAILAGVRRQVAEWKKAGTERQFMPSPTKWLGGQRWEDDIPEIKAPSHAEGATRKGLNGQRQTFRDGYWFSS